ncbi:MAG: Bax inhibitor-1/YccA family protein [Chloroflexi bacterium]|nr:Bax inhibitor-1/YccA family protein [Chloroflexota bacterium]
MFDRDRNPPDRYQSPLPGQAPYGQLPPSVHPGGVMINGERVGAVPREGFLTMSFVWMFVALLVSAAAAYFVFASPRALQFVAQYYIGLILAELALVFVISLAINRIGAMVGLALLFIYALLNGLTIGVIVYAFFASGQVSAVVSSFLGASAIFGAAALYGFATRRDLTGIGGILFMGLIGLVVMSFVQIFFFRDSNTFSLVIGAVGVLIFTGLTAYDVQRLKNGQMPGVKDAQSASVIGALSLYLDFINLFLMLLRIFGSSRN